MKKKFLLIPFVAIGLAGCQDNTGSLGLGMLPDGDGMTVGTKTFSVTTRSVVADSVFAKTDTCYLGKYTDPDFGYYESSYLTQFYCVDSLRFRNKYDPAAKKSNAWVMTGDTTHRTDLVIYYRSCFGDTLNACHLNVYELNKKIDKLYYTNLDPANYYDPSKILGGKAYTAYDLTVSDSIRALGGYVPTVQVPMPKELGERILRANREHPDYFDDMDKFIDNVLKGVYVNVDQGDGTILNVYQTALKITYPCFILDSLGNKVKEKATGQDTIVYDAVYFVSTKEVMQANRFRNSDKLQQKADEKDWTYIKSPAGIFTEATLPVQEIANELSKDTLNAVRLTLPYYAQPTGQSFAMYAPKEMLLVRKKDVKSFFENNMLADNITSYLNSAASNPNQYVFANLSRLVTYCVNEKKAAKAEALKNGQTWDEAKWEADTEWNKVMLIPVKVQYTTITSGTSTQTIIAGILNDMRPGYAKLKGGENNPLTLDVSFTSFNE